MNRPDPITCPECGAAYLPNPDGCTRCAVAADSAAEHDRRMTAWRERWADHQPITVAEAFAAIGLDTPGGAR